MIYAGSIKYTTRAIQSLDIPLLWSVFTVLLVIYCLSFVLRFFWRHRGRFASIAMKHLLRAKYLNKYLLLDNNYVEAQ